MQLTRAILEGRRDINAVRELSSRIEAEYMEMPGLKRHAATGATVVDGRPAHVSDGVRSVDRAWSLEDERKRTIRSGLTPDQTGASRSGRAT